MNDTIFAPGARFEPYWWEDAPRPSLPEVAPPKTVEVAIVGSGLTGLAAALTLARAGRNVIVFEAGDPGFGASLRNGGMVGGDLKWSVFAPVDRFGKAPSPGQAANPRPLSFAWSVPSTRTRMADPSSPAPIGTWKPWLGSS